MLLKVTLMTLTRSVILTRCIDDLSLHHLLNQGIDLGCQQTTSPGSIPSIQVWEALILPQILVEALAVLDFDGGGP
jgi:hypothetical protein